MAITPIAVSSNTINKGYTNGIDSLYSFNLVPQKMAELYDLYGDGFGIKEFLYFAGQTVNVKSKTVSVIERGSLEKGIKIGSTGIVSTGAGANITFQLAADMYDSNFNTFLAVDDAIFIPTIYLTGTTLPAKYQIISRTSADAASVFTAMPFSSTANITTTVPANTVIMATGGNFSRGSDGPASKSRGWYERSFTTAVKKRGFAVEGGATATERYTDTLVNGEPGFFSLASIEADRLLDSDENDEIFLGQLNSNSSFVMPNRDSVNNAVQGTQGLWSHLVTGGMKQTYVDAYAISDLADVKSLFESQGVIDKNAFFGVGSELYRFLEDSGLEFIKEYSGGTDLMKTYGELGVNFKAFTRNGITFTLQGLQNFSSPVKYGLSAYNWKKAGFILPQSKVTVRMGGMEGDEVVLDNLTLGYLNNNGENRTRIVKLLKGVEGHTGTGDAVDTFDDIRGQMLSEFMLMVTKRNQMIQVTPTVF